MIEETHCWTFGPMNRLLGLGRQTHISATVLQEL